MITVKALGFWYTEHSQEKSDFLKIFGGHKSFSWGHWYPCFWTSGDVYPGFQIQGGSLFCMLSRLCDLQIHLWCDTCWLKREKLVFTFVHVKVEVYGDWNYTSHKIPFINNRLLGGGLPFLCTAHISYVPFTSTELLVDKSMFFINICSHLKRFELTLPDHRLNTFLSTLHTTIQGSLDTINRS